MPLAVTHILTSIIAVGLYRDHVTKHKRYFTLHTVFIAGLAGLLPDLDIAFRMMAKVIGVNLHWLLQHGEITHTPLFGLLFLIPAFILWSKKKHKIAMYFFVITFGIMLHLFLDYVIGGGAGEGVMWFFPFSMQAYKIHILNYFAMKDIPVAMDAVLLLGYLWYMEIKHKISDFV